MLVKLCYPTGNARVSDNNVICYYTTSTINKYFLSSYLMISGTYLLSFEKIQQCIPEFNAKTKRDGDRRDGGRGGGGGSISHVPGLRRGGR